MDELDQVAFKLGVYNCGMELISFHCCDKGIEFEMGTAKCNAPTAPGQRPPRRQVF